MLSNVTASPPVSPSAPPLSLPVSPADLSIVSLEKRGLDTRLGNMPEIVRMNFTRLEPGAFRLPVPNASSQPVSVLKTRIGGVTVTEWIRRFGAALWQGAAVPGDTAPPPDGIRRQVVDALGGRQSHEAQQASRQFSELRRYLLDLRRSRDHYQSRHPRQQPLIDESANRFMRTATDRISSGFHEGDAGAAFAYYIEGRIERARAAEGAAARAMADVGRRAEIQTQAQARRITDFWNTELGRTDRWLEYALQGDMVFETIEEMEKNCPPGHNDVVFDAHIGTSLNNGRFRYEGGVLQDAYLRQPGGGRRKVVFRGPTWLHADQDPDRLGPSDRRAANPHRHFNAHWNGAPAVVQARIAGSQVVQNAR